MPITQTYTSDGPVSASSAQTFEAPPVPVTHSHPSTHQDHTIPHTDCEECRAAEAKEAVSYLRHSSMIVNGNVIPNLRVLLGLVLRTVDAAVPNKDQNRAMKETIHDQFDAVYFDILKRTWPDANYASTGAHAIFPETNRTKAFDTSVIEV